MQTVTTEVNYGWEDTFQPSGVVTMNGAHIFLGDVGSRKYVLEVGFRMTLWHQGGAGSDRTRI